MALFASATASATRNPTAASKSQDQAQSNNLYNSQKAKTPSSIKPTRKNLQSPPSPSHNHVPLNQTSHHSQINAQVNQETPSQKKEHQIRSTNQTLQIRTQQLEQQRIERAYKQSQSKSIHSKRERVNRRRRRRGRRRPVKLESLMLAWARSAKRTGLEGWRSMAWE